MKYKVRMIDKEYPKLVNSIPKDVTYRHLSNALFLLSLPLIGNVANFILAIQCRLTKKEIGVFK